MSTAEHLRKAPTAEDAKQTAANICGSCCSDPRLASDVLRGGLLGAVAAQLMAHEADDDLGTRLLAVAVKVLMIASKDTAMSSCFDDAGVEAMIPLLLRRVARAADAPCIVFLDMMLHSERQRALLQAQGVVESLQQAIVALLGAHGDEVKVSLANVVFGMARSVPQLGAALFDSVKAAMALERPWRFLAGAASVVAVSGSLVFEGVMAILPAARAEAKEITGAWEAFADVSAALTEHAEDPRFEECGRAALTALLAEMPPKHNSARAAAAQAHAAKFLMQAGHASAIFEACLLPAMPGLVDIVIRTTSPQAACAVVGLLTHAPISAIDDARLAALVARVQDDAGHPATRQQILSMLACGLAKDTACVGPRLLHAGFLGALITAMGRQSDNASVQELTAAAAGLLIMVRQQPGCVELLRADARCQDAASSAYFLAPRCRAILQRAMQHLNPAWVPAHPAVTESIAAGAVTVDPSAPAAPGNDDCAICHGCVVVEGLQPAWTKLPCKHLFHTSCIQRWAATGAMTCPLCNTNMAGSNAAINICCCDSHDVALLPDSEDDVF